MGACTTTGPISLKYESCTKQLVYVKPNCEGSATTIDIGDGKCIGSNGTSAKVTCGGAAALKPVAALIAALLAMLMFSML
eukprot:NODE_5806_length_486_cov_338.080092_g4353_i0.p2 GENE.NODE_5806_length_486_cov_338.080092_g4353_i0~~NODE_5806_length_486_cov_338.080092_g4353_i0.p2  ORF type:complete len:89 (-),score=47.30 NODE_5806_length_486_cov_338.080092_g4353_i0:220-459(-)